MLKDELQNCHQITCDDLFRVFHSNLENGTKSLLAKCWRVGAVVCLGLGDEYDPGPRCEEVGDDHINLLVFSDR